MLAEFRLARQAGGDWVLVDILATKGSAPRAAGTFMLVSEFDLVGTIGGGHLEHQAIVIARNFLSGGYLPNMADTILGPDSGQCCGGRVTLTFALVDRPIWSELEDRLMRQDDARKDVFLFGAGHVGRALVNALAPLPFSVSMVETRADELGKVGSDIAKYLTPIPEAEVARIRPGGAAIILTHDHGLDFLIATAALERSDLAYVGMIGSKTKRGVFLSHLRKNGHDPGLADRLVLPIGSTTLVDKRPEVIAALVAAELLHALA